MTCRPMAPPREWVAVQVAGGLASGSLLAVDAATLSGTLSFVAKETRCMALSRVHSYEPLELAIEINPDPIEPEELLDVQIGIGNPTGSPTGNLSMRFLWPEHIYGTPVVTGGGSCPGGSCSAGEYLYWDTTDLGSLPPGQTLTVGFNETIWESAPDGTVIPFEIELFESGVLARTLSHSVVVGADSPLELTVDPLLDPAAPGDVLVFELTCGNNGDDVSSGTLLQFPLPQDSSFLSATGTGSHNGGVVTWMLDDLSAHGAAREWVAVQVAGDLASGSLLAVDAATLSGTLSFVAKETRCMALSRVHSDEPLELAIEVNPDPIEPEELLDVQIGIGNPTGSPTGNLSMRFLWPEHIYGTPVVTGGGSCPGGSCSAGEYLYWDTTDLGSLPPGQTLTVGFNETIWESAPEGTVIPFEIELFESGLLARTLSHSVVVGADSPLELTVDPRLDPAAPGDVLVYDFTYGNNGDDISSGTLLQFPLPQGSSFLSATGAGSHTEGVVTWMLDDLEAHSGGWESLSVQVAGDLANGSLLAVHASTLSGTVSFVAKESQTMAVSRLHSSESLELSAEFDPRAVDPGELLDVRISIGNPTGSPTGDLSLRVLWPEHISSSPVVTGGGSCPGGSCSAGEYLYWDTTDMGSLPPDQTLTVGFNETIWSSATDGTVIPFEIQLFEGGRFVREISVGILVGDGEAPPLQHHLTVSAAGEGTVISNPLGIDCPSDCATFFTGSQVTLTATPDDGWIFDEWGEDCSGTDPTCILTLSADRHAAATFLQCQGTGIYVEQDNGCNGNSPCFDSIQDGMQAVASLCDPVKVALGTYYENLALDESKTILLKCGWSSDFTIRQTNHPFVIGSDTGGYTNIEGWLSINKGTIIFD